MNDFIWNVFSYMSMCYWMQLLSYCTYLYLMAQIILTQRWEVGMSNANSLEQLSASKQVYQRNPLNYFLSTIIQISAAYHRVGYLPSKNSLIPHHCHSMPWWRHLGSHCVHSHMSRQFWQDLGCFSEWTLKGNS